MTDIVKSQKKRPAIGRMRHRVVIQSRNLEQPAFGSAEIDELFSTGRKRWALVIPVAGRTIFLDASRGDVAITHEVYTRFDPKIEDDWWVLLSSGERLKVERTQDIAERHEFLKLYCNTRGFVTAEASKA